MRKYEFTGETMEFEGYILRRIRYRYEGKYMKKDFLGGWIEGEHNLSHEGESCVLGVAKVFGNAKVLNDAVVGNKAIVKDNVIVKDSAFVFGASIVGGDTVVDTSSSISGNSRIFFYSLGECEYNKSHISGESLISNTTIESTGRILNSSITNKDLEGALNLENKTLI